MAETRPTVYVCASCGHSSRVFDCDPDLAHHDGVTDHGREFRMPSDARGKGS
jgi:hypothetical protein